MHGAQFPPLQTMPEPVAPQLVPFGWLPVSEQTGDPVAQVTVPVLQALVGGRQESPAGHATQLPPLQTLPVPQVCPLLSGFPVSVQLMSGVQT
jgi:hypothetical protein